MYPLSTKHQIYWRRHLSIEHDKLCDEAEACHGDAYRNIIRELGRDRRQDLIQAAVVGVGGSVLSLILLPAFWAGVTSTICIGFAVYLKMKSDNKKPVFLEAGIHMSNQRSTQRLLDRWDELQTQISNPKYGQEKWAQELGLFENLEVVEAEIELRESKVVGGSQFFPNVNIGSIWGKVPIIASQKNT